MDQGLGEKRSAVKSIWQKRILRTGVLFTGSKCSLLQECLFGLDRYCWLEVEDCKYIPNANPSAFLLSSSVSSKTRCAKLCHDCCPWCWSGDNSWRAGFNKWWETILTHCKHSFYLLFNLFLGSNTVVFLFSSWSSLFWYQVVKYSLVCMFIMWVK